MVIELEAISKRFGARWAVKDLTLRVPPREIYGLLGHNGAGKSTVIGMILGQVWPTAGSARIGGFNVVLQRRRALAQVGAIFETPAFYDYLSGWRNLEILASYAAPVSAGRMREVIEWVGLSGRERSPVRTYSHGMRARLALAQALLPDPQLLILDEPGDGLDPEGIHEMRRTILRLHQELGLTILLSSHLLNEVEQLCTRIAVLRHGRMIFEGALPQAHPNPRRFRLQADDFERAATLLQGAGLIAGWNQDHTIDLAEPAGIDQVVRHLVRANVAVFEIAGVETTLEDFYLDLMKGESAPPAATGPAGPGL